MPDESSTESQALKKLKEERAADAERIRLDFVRSQRLRVARASAQQPPKPKKDEC
jgi:hypothetical protein